MKYENNLNSARCYLAGPINFCKNDGVTWRNQFKQGLKDRGINMIVIDPCHKPCDQESVVQKEKVYSNQLKEQGKWDELKSFVKQYRHMDLRYVDISDCIIALIDTSIHMCGTYDEIFVAERQKKPIITLCPQGKSGLPDWMYAVLNLDSVFCNVEQCLDYLEQVNKDINQANEDWLLINKFIGDTNEFQTV